MMSLAATQAVHLREVCLENRASPYTTLPLLVIIADISKSSTELVWLELTLISSTCCRVIFVSLTLLLPGRWAP